MQDFLKEIMQARYWEDSILPALRDFIEIPNCSPAFTQFHDPEATERAVLSLLDFAYQYHELLNLKVSVLRTQKNPLIFVDVPGTGPGSVLAYCHLDKQPPLEGSGWFTRSAYKAGYENGKLYGRGSVDDGYAFFTLLTALRVLAEQQVPYPRCVILVESAEESGSPGLAEHIEELHAEIGNPDLIICPDSGCKTYDRLYLNTSLRGVIAGNLTVKVASAGQHSGHVGGKMPVSSLVAMYQLSKICDLRTQQVHQSFWVDIPDDRRLQRTELVRAIGSDLHSDLPLLPGVQPLDGGNYGLETNGTWNPSLAIIGAEGLPALADSGNVLLPYTTFRLSLRIPPTANANFAAEKMKEILESNPPFSPEVTFTPDKISPGWNAPRFEPWLLQSLSQASMLYFNKSMLCQGEGGTIPLMNLLARKYPGAQFFVTGLLGPDSNAHGFNESLDLGAAEKLTACFAQVFADCARRGSVDLATESVEQPTGA